MTMFDMPLFATLEIMEVPSNPREERPVRSRKLAEHVSFKLRAMGIDVDALLKKPDENSGRKEKIDSAKIVKNLSKNQKTIYMPKWNTIVIASNDSLMAGVMLQKTTNRIYEIRLLHRFKISLRKRRKKTI